MDNRTHKSHEATSVAAEVASLSGRLLLRVPEAAAVCALSKSKGYELVANGCWPSIRIGKAVRVPSDGLMRWVEEQTEDRG